MRVSAFSGDEHIMALHQNAIAQRHWFFSDGEAVLLQRLSLSK